MKNLQSFQTFRLNESLMQANPNFGVYDFSNENHETFNEVLAKNNVEFVYDPYHNVTQVITDSPENIHKLMEENNFKIIKTDWSCEDDCIIIRKKTGPNPPPGAYM